jgi:signal transduction histidine kinase
VAAERGRIARELHDVIAHSVSLMGVQAGAVERVLERDPDRAREALRSIQATARESVGELRRLLGILRADQEPAGLAPQPGLGALAALIEESRRAGLPTELAVDGEARPLPAGVELSAYRVAQEALTNVRKHAPGARTSVVVRYGPDDLELCVRNAAAATNGAEPASGTSHGLVGMRERVALYGGSLEARPEPGGGFLVRARLPVEVAP